MSKITETGIERVVRLAGSQTALARILRVTPQAVQKWVAQGFVTSEHCRTIESHYPNDITRYDLNPSVFGSREEAIACLCRLGDPDSGVEQFGETSLNCDDRSTGANQGGM
jgi:DNA-binding transcriptional regulator YdaS (Cro superfamily)